MFTSVEVFHDIELQCRLSCPSPAQVHILARSSTTFVRAKYSLPCRMLLSLPERTIRALGSLYVIYILLVSGCRVNIDAFGESCIPREE